jgi:hypothetical protein
MEFVLLTSSLILMAGSSVTLLRVAFSYIASKKYGISEDFKVCIIKLQLIDWPLKAVFS